MTTRSAKQPIMISDSSQLTLHTDQQSLILADMICARNKLQEENQQLRDKLQDAEMLIRLLHCKLVETTSASPKNKNQSSSVCCSASSSATIKSWRQMRKRTPSVMAFKKDVFKNSLIPGKRTFESQTGSLTSVKASVGNSGPLSSPSRRPIGNSKPPPTTTTTMTRPALLEGTSASSSDRNEIEGVYQPVGKIRNSKTVKVHDVDYRTKDTEPTHDDRREMKGVIGMLAQSVINEYSSPEDVSRR